MFATLIFLALILYLILKARINFEAAHKSALLTSMAGLVVTSFALAYWSSIYDKLWLQPIACIFFLCGLGLRAGVTVNFQRYLRAAGIALIVTEAALTLALKGVPDHFHETTYLPEAKEVAELVKAQDTVVCDWTVYPLLIPQFSETERACRYLLWPASPGLMRR